MTGIGRMLIEAREAKRLSLEQVERDTRIVRRYLEALEREDFAAFPFEVYARGFLRSYAGYLGLNGADLVALMPASSREQPDVGGPAKPLSTHGDGRRPGRPPPARPPASTPVRPHDNPLPPPARPQPQRPEAAGAPRAGAPPPPPTRPQPTAGRRAARPDAEPSPARAQPPAAPLRLFAVIGAVLSTALVLGLVVSRCSDSSLGGERRAAPGLSAPSPAGSAQPPAAAPTAIAGRMPNLRGMDETEALAQLSALGVTPFVIELPSRDTPAGQVMRQSPEPNSTIGKATVTVVISRGG